MKSVDGFTVQGRLGAGGFSIVWAAVRDADGAESVLKVGRDATPVLVERFQREAAAMERVGPPHVPALHGRGLTADGRPYLAMERLHGETLAERLAREARPPALGWIARAGGALLSALGVAHARGLLHRDLKPANIFLADGDRRVVLLDFGLARRTDVVEPELTRTGVAVGTPFYMAPEQILGAGEPGPAADLYSFGVILFELLTLRVPFTGEASTVEHAHLALRPPRPSELSPVPAALEELVLACLAKEPERRPPSAAALRRDLEAALAAASPGPPPPDAPPRAAAELRAPRLIAEARHLAVLAVVDSDAEASAIIDLIARRGGFVARQRGRRYVAAFAGHAVEDPARAAVAAAAALAAQHGARAALHLAPITLRRREGAAAAVYGSAVERPEAWMPAEPWDGVRLSPDLAAVLPAAPAAGAAETHEIAAGITGDPSAEPGPTLRGREEVLAALEQSARVPLIEARPALLTLIGDHGLGKTRLLAEAAAIAGRLSAGAAILRLCPPPGGARGLAGELLRDLGEEPAAADAPARAGALAEALQRRARAAPIAVVLDDAHWAEPELLDALELATLDGAALPLWVVITALPRFESSRPGWGARTRTHARAILAPLAEPDAAALAAELLRPAEYPPAAVLEHLARWSAGNPASLSSIVRALKRAGVVRRRPDAASWYVATADLDTLPASPAWQWLAARRLAVVPPELAALARLCAVLGISFWREELARVQDALERAGGAATPVDIGYGLRALTDVGILAKGASGRGERGSFRDALLQDALHEMLEPAQRRAVHEQALAYWRGKASALEAAASAGAAEDHRGGDAGPTLTEGLEALARHALAVGERDEAADALARLGEMALARHRHVEADQRFTAALSAAREGDARLRARILGGRGRSRVPLHRPSEAIADLQGARALAAGLGDEPLTAELLLEEATALDWHRGFEESAQRVQEARLLIERAGAAWLRAPLLVAEGRSAYRRAQTHASIILLQEGLAAAEAEGHHGSRVIALLLLGMQLSLSDRTAEAARSFDEVIRLTTRSGDLPHLCSAYLNRPHLWLALQEHGRAIDDMQRSVALARELGNPMLERLASLNTAELLYWVERTDEALALARRARMLEERFMERRSAWASLLLARILAAAEAWAEVGIAVEEIHRDRPPDLMTSENAPAMRATLRMLELILEEAGLRPHGEADPGAAWGELMRSTERLLREERAIYPDDLLEVLHWSARVGARAGRAAQVAAARAHAAPWLHAGSIWTPRFEDLGVPR